MKRITPLLLLICCTMQVWAQDSDAYKETFLLAYKAIEEKKPEQLKEYLIKDNDRSEEATLALAELLVEIQSGQFNAFHKTYNEEIRTLNTKPLNKQMMQLSGFFMMPPIKEVAEHKLVKEDDKTYLVSYKGNDNLQVKSKFEVQMREGKWYFWPASIAEPNQLIALTSFLKKYKAVFEHNAKELRPEAIQKLIDEYVKPTALSYAEQPIEGKINGEAWVFQAGQAKQSMSFGKKEISITLSDAPQEKDCPAYLSGNKIIFSIEKEGEYDLALSGMNVTLFTESSNRNTAVDDGKIEVTIDKVNKTVSGRIVVKKGDGNYVNGLFEIPICGSLD